MISASFIAIFIIKILAFAISIPLSGYLTAWFITHVTYDKQYANDNHMYSLFDYFDIFGSACFFFLGFGWGTILPIDQDYISGKYQKLRTFLAYSAQALVSIFLAICAIIPSVLLTGRECIHTAFRMFFSHSLQHIANDPSRYIFQQHATYFAHCSPYAITGTLFLIGVLYIQCSMLCISMVSNIFQVIMRPFRFQILTSQYAWLMLVIPLVFCLLFYQFFFALTINFIIFLIEFFSYILKGT